MFFDDVEATNMVVTTKLHSQTNYLISLPQTKPFLLPSLTNLPKVMLNEIMKKLGKQSYVSFINEKAICKLIRDVGQEHYVFNYKRLSVNQVMPI